MDLQLARRSVLATGGPGVDLATFGPMPCPFTPPVKVPDTTRRS